MAVTAASIKELREITGAGMVDCKNALTNSDGDIEKAIELLREKGLATAAKKAGRIASEGLVYSYVTEDGKTSVITEVNSETDFVAKNPGFVSFINQVMQQAVTSDAGNMDEFYAEKWVEDSSITVRDVLNQKIALFGENLNIRRFDKYTAGENSHLVSYIHGGGRVSVMIELSCAAENNAIIEAGKNLCMQIAAMNPKFVDRASVPADFIEKEKEILTQLVLSEGKPANIAEKIVQGKLNKELQEFCLVDQEYVKDSEMSVAKYLEAVGKEVGQKISITRFVRYETGEGIEKKDENFADEVNKAIKG